MGGISPPLLVEKSMNFKNLKVGQTMVVASVTPCLVFDKKPNAKQVKELHMGPSGNTVHDVGNPMSLEKFTKEFTKKYLQEWY